MHCKSKRGFVGLSHRRSEKYTPTPALISVYANTLSPKSWESDYIVWKIVLVAAVGVCTGPIHTYLESLNSVRCF